MCIFVSINTCIINIHGCLNQYTYNRMIFTCSILVVMEFTIMFGSKFIILKILYIYEWNLCLTVLFWKHRPAWSVLVDIIVRKRILSFEVIYPLSKFIDAHAGTSHFKHTQSLEKLSHLKNSVIKKLSYEKNSFIIASSWLSQHLFPESTLIVCWYFYHNCADIFIIILLIFLS